MTPADTVLPGAAPDAAPDVALSSYDLGEILEVQRLESGIINTTYEVTASKGRFILQRLHHVFDERVVEDAAIVQEHLRSCGIGVPALVAARDGGLCVTHEGVWRVYTYIGHDDVAINELLAYEAGRSLALLHNALATLRYTPRFGIPGFHQTERIIAKLRRIVHSDDEKFANVLLEYEFITNAIPQHYLPASLPRQLIHGDPKFSNFLFKDRRVVGVIDFDTLMVASPLLDIGDALRSWCSKRDGAFSREIYDAAVEGYLGASAAQYDEAAISSAVALITLELAARFLIDYFEECYFQWDRTRFRSAAEFNLFRCREQLALYCRLMRRNLAVIRS